MVDISIEMREMKANEQAIYADIFAQSFNQEPWNENWTQEKAEGLLGKLMNQPAFWGICATENEQILGFLCGRAIQTDKEKSFFCVELCVAPKYQGKKIGSRLLENARKQLIVHGVSSMEIGTDKNTLAEKFYQKHGFMVTKSEKRAIYMKWSFEQGEGNE